MTIDRIENQAGIFRIPLTLTLGDAKISDIIRIAGVTQKAAYRAIYQLAEMGWIIETQTKKFPFTRTIKLTSKGKRAVKLIKQLEPLTDIIPEFHYNKQREKIEIKGWTLDKAKKKK